MSTFSAGSSTSYGIQGHNKIKNVTIYNSLSTVPSGPQFVTDKRPASTVDLVTWNTLQFTPILIIDRHNKSTRIVDLSDMFSTLIAKETISDFLEVDIRNTWIRRLINQGLGKDVVHYAIRGSDDLAKSIIKKFTSTLEDLDESKKIIFMQEYMARDIEGYPKGYVPKLDDIKNIRINKCRLKEWYNHLVASCSTWKFPMNTMETTLSNVWDVSTCTPDIPIKLTEKISYYLPENSWTSWLEGEYLVMIQDNVEFLPDDAPSGALMISNHMLSLISQGSRFCSNQQKKFLESFGKIALLSKVSKQGDLIFKYDNTESNCCDSSSVIRHSDKYCNYWIT